MAKIGKSPIPSLPTSLPRDQQPFFNAIREQLQILADHGRGNRLDAAVTRREFEAGQKQVVQVINKAAASLGEVEDPTVPTGVNASSNDRNVSLYWDPPEFKGYWYTDVVMLAIETGFDLPQGTTLDDSISGQPTGFFSDNTVIYETRYVLWCRHVNLDGKVSAWATPVETTTSSPIDLQDTSVDSQHLSLALQARLAVIDWIDVNDIDGETGLVNFTNRLNTELQTVDGDVLEIYQNMSAFGLYDQNTGNWAGNMDLQQVSSDWAERIIKTEFYKTDPVTGEEIYKTAGIGFGANASGGTILFQADKIGFLPQNADPLVDDPVLPFRFENDILYAKNIKVVELDAWRITNTAVVDADGNTIDPPFATIDKLSVQKEFELGSGLYIQERQIDPAFRAGILRASLDSTVTGGTREQNFIPSTGYIGTTQYLAKETGSAGSGDAPILSGGAATSLTVRAVGGVTGPESTLDFQFKSNVSGFNLAPKVSFTFYRRELPSGTAEALATQTLLGSYWIDRHEGEDPQTGEPLISIYATSIDRSYILNVPGLPNAGSEYEYYIVFDDIQGHWGRNGNIEVIVKETENYSNGASIEALFYEGNTWLTSNHGGGTQRGVSIPSVGTSTDIGYYVKNWAIKVADNTGALYYKGNDTDGRYIKKPNSPSNNHVLTYNSTTGEWESKAAGGVDLSSYATMSWVNSALSNYVTSTWVTNQGYATTTWVNNQGFLKSGDVNLSGYALTSHNHDSVYAAISHTHTGYASTTHNHDSSYAAISHTHSQYAPINSPTFTGTVKAPAFWTTSSIRYKNIEQRINPYYSLDMISRIGAKGVAFGRWKDGRDSRDYRWLIAEEVNEIFPELVAKNEKGECETLDYIGLIGDLCAAIATLNKKVNELEAKIG